MEKRQQRGLFTVPGLLLAFCSFYSFGHPQPISSLLGSFVPFYSFGHPWSVSLLSGSLVRAPLSHFILLDILGSFYHFRAPLSHFILLGILDLFHRFRASLSHSGSFVPFVFPWVSRACLLSMGFLGAFPNFTSPWAFTEFFGLPGPIMLFLILGILGLAINPLLSLFLLLWTYRSPFSLFHIIYCPWFAFSLFSNSFKIGRAHV